MKSHRVIAEFAETIDSRATISLFKKLRRAYRFSREINLFVDNASYRHSEAVPDYLESISREKRGRIVLHFLPTYSPNLNLIERLWKLMKKKILCNRWYETFAEFTRAVQKFFGSRRKYRPELETLMTENFHLFQMT